MCLYQSLTGLVMNTVFVARRNAVISVYNYMCDADVSRRIPCIVCLSFFLLAKKRVHLPRMNDLEENTKS